MDELTATVAETRANFSKIAKTVNANGRPVTVFKNSNPWVVIAPVGRGYWNHTPAIDWATLDVVAIDKETRKAVLRDVPPGMLGADDMKTIGDFLSDA